MLNCQQASQFISASLDKPLTLRERFALGAHLFICKHCKRFSQQLQTMRVAIKQITHTIEDDKRIKMSTEATNRIKKLLGDTA